MAPLGRSWYALTIFVKGPSIVNRGSEKLEKFFFFNCENLRPWLELVLVGFLSWWAFGRSWPGLGDEGNMVLESLGRKLSTSLLLICTFSGKGAIKHCDMCSTMPSDV